uniref:Glycine-rich cell wall structural protein-like n=1 Tax=Haemonchus contortus TaxID=6289 RepID=A0A7I5EBZ5_HAECO
MNKLVLIISAASICIVSSQWGPASVDTAFELGRYALQNIFR